MLKMQNYFKKCLQNISFPTVFENKTCFDKLILNLTYPVFIVIAFDASHGSKLRANES